MGSVSITVFAQALNEIELLPKYNTGELVVQSGQGVVRRRPCPYPALKVEFSQRYAFRSLFDWRWDDGDIGLDKGLSLGVELAGLAELVLHRVGEVVLVDVLAFLGRSVPLGGT